MTYSVGRRIPKGYYIRIKKGTSKQQLKELLFTSFDDPDYDYDDTVGSIYNTILERNEVIVVRRDCGYSWFKGMDLTNYKEFFYEDIGDL